MAFSTAMPTSFKVDLLRGVHNFTASTGNTFKIALGKATGSLVGTYNATTTSYTNLTSNSDELPNGNGYATGGATLSSVTPVASGTTAVCDFDNYTWTNATFSTSGAIIYNDTAAGKNACAVLSFGGNQQVSSGDFQIQFPAATSAAAIIRIA